jgi:hypothetical protein
MTIAFAYKERKPTDFGYIDTWEWSAPDAVVSIGGVDVPVLNVKAVRSRETADAFVEVAGPVCDEVTVDALSFSPWYDALACFNVATAIDNTRSRLHIRDVVTTGGSGKSIVTRVTLLGRIYEEESGSC